MPISDETKRPTISDVRLGWLQRFCSLASQGDLVRAGHACHADPTVVSDSIQRLEDVVCRPLMAPATSYIPTSGQSFLKDAKHILVLTAALSPRPAGHVSISWFMALIAISHHENYAAAARSLGWTRYKVMRGVAELANWIEHPLVLPNQGFKLTMEGENAVRVGKEIISVLENSKGDSEVWWKGKMKNRRIPWWIKAFHRKTFKFNLPARDE